MEPQERAFPMASAQNSSLEWIFCISIALLVSLSFGPPLFGLYMAQHRKISPMKKIALGTGVFSAVMYAIIICVNFDPKTCLKQAEAFGVEPMGLPVTLVVACVETLLFLPMPWVFWHFGRLLIRDTPMDPWQSYLLARTYPNLRRSRMVCIGGLLYSVLIFAGWIFLASSGGYD
jgi:hypothetical protein